MVADADQVTSLTKRFNCVKRTETNFLKATKMIQMETEAKQIKEDAEGLMILTIGPDLDHRRANLITKVITMSRENIIAIKVQELIINKLVAIKAVQSS